MSIDLLFKILWGIPVFIIIGGAWLCTVIWLLKTAWDMVTDLIKYGEW